MYGRSPAKNLTAPVKFCPSSVSILAPICANKTNLIKDIKKIKITKLLLNLDAADHIANWRPSKWRTCNFFDFPFVAYQFFKHV